MPKLIKNININTQDLPSASSMRFFYINGDPGAVFTFYLVNEVHEETTTNKGAVGHYYDFETKQFVASGFKGLLQAEIPEDGSYQGSIKFPAITDDDEYNIYIVAEKHFDTEFDSSIVKSGFIYKIPNFDTSTNADGSLTYPASIYQYVDKAVRVKFESANTNVTEDNSGLFNTITITAGPFTGTVSTGSVTGTASVSASDLSISLDRQPLATDFYATTNGIVDGASSSSTSVTFDDVSGLQIGFTFYSATGTSTIPTTKPTITDINISTKTITLSAAVSVENDATVTFRGYGSSAVDFITGISYNTSSLSAALPTTGPSNQFNMSKISANIFDSTQGIVTPTTGSMVGIKVGNSVSATGLGEGNEGDDTAILISSIDADQITLNTASLSTAFGIVAGTKFFFKGSANQVTITTNFVITNISKTAAASTIITLDLDKFLTITDSF
jgi:hypothetical protein